MLHLQDNIKKYLPEMPDYAYKITIEHLLTHTSGIRDWQELLWLNNWNPLQTITPSVIYKLIITQQSLNSPPGEKFLYSNSNYDLLAEIIRRTTGNSLNEFARNNLFIPLGMENTQYRQSINQVISLRASGYDKQENGQFEYSNYNDIVAGSSKIYTSIKDLLKWDDLFYSQEDTVKAIISQMTTKTRIKSGKLEPYGCGLQLTNFQGYPVQEHSGALSADRGYYIRIPDVRLSLIILSNNGDIYPWAVSGKVLKEIFYYFRLPDKSQNVAITQESKTAKSDLSLFVGVYGPQHKIGPGKIITLKNNSLYLNNTLELEPINDSTFSLKVNPDLLFTFTRSSSIHPNLQVSRLGDVLEQAVWLQKQKFTPTINDYIGTYRSEELNANYQILSKDGQLLLKKSESEVLPLDVTYRDAFQNEPLFLNFTHSGSGTINGFYLSTYQTNNIVFKRLTK